MSINVFIVSGATDGIGRVTAQELARTGNEVILIGRDLAKAEHVAEQIRRDSGNERVFHELADLSSQSDIRALAARLNSRPERPSVLINNVGAWFHRRLVSSDGVEMTFALNHLSYFLLTGLLLEGLKSLPNGRVINVASMAHRGPQIDFNDPQGDDDYSGWRAYQASKLANILFTFRLADKLAGSGVTANCLHPGFVRSKFGHNNSGWAKWGIIMAQRLAAISEKKGAVTSLHLAASGSVESVNGKYFVKSRIAKSSPQSRDASAAKKLWQLSEELTGLAY